MNIAVFNEVPYLLTCHPKKSLFWLRLIQPMKTLTALVPSLGGGSWREGCQHNYVPY